MANPRKVGTLSKRVPELQIISWGFLLNVIWEFGHSPLYTDHSLGWQYVIWSRLHCTVGDVMILISCFWINAIVFRTRFWMIERSVAAFCLFATLGIGYTIFSEWLNTVVRQSWTYTETMPTLFGIGLSPVLQWLLVPLALWGVMRFQAYSKSQLA